MPAHSPSAMPRLKIYYHTAYNQHVITLHFATGTDAALAVTNGQSVCNQLRTVLPTSAGFDRAEYIAAGTNVANAVAWTGITGNATGYTDNIQSAATALVLVGRTVGGCRARLVLFDPAFVPDANYRAEVTEYTLLASLLTYLNSSSCPLVALDGLTPLWKSYGNVTPFRHWIRARRRLGG